MIVSNRSVSRSRTELYATEVGLAHDMTIADVLGESRNRSKVAARRQLWQRLKHEGFSVAAIGRATGFHHTTVLYGLRRIGA